MSQENEDKVREFYAARQSGNMDTLSSAIDRLFHDDVVWHYPGRNALARDYVGKEGVKTFFRSLREITRGTFRIEIEDVVANDKHAVALELPRAERNGGTFHWNAALHYLFHESKIREVRVYQHTQYAVDEFWAELELIPSDGAHSTGTR